MRFTGTFLIWNSTRYLTYVMQTRKSLIIITRRTYDHVTDDVPLTLDADCWTDTDSFRQKDAQLEFHFRICRQMENQLDDRQTNIPAQNQHVTKQTNNQRQDVSIETGLKADNKHEFCRSTSLVLVEYTGNHEANCQVHLTGRVYCKKWGCGPLCSADAESYT